MSEELVRQIYRDSEKGLLCAASAIQHVSDPEGEDYIVASQSAIRRINRAFGHAMSLFLQSHGRAPDDSLNSRIHQLRRSRNCPLDRSQIRALLDNNALRNQLVHRTPRRVEAYEVQRAAHVLYAALPHLVPREPWSDLLGKAWIDYTRQLGRWGIAESEPHNLPRPDYTEFIGRTEEISRVRDAFEHDRHWVISIDGIGGVGKSALALHIAYGMASEIRRGICPWKYIVWVSAKSDRLPATATGIQSQEPGFKVLEDLFDEILLVSGFLEYVDRDVSEKQEMVHLVLESHPLLLFIDNFETVTDESVLGFVDDLPGASLTPGHKVVVTSRHRTFGRPVRLKGLAKWEAEKLITKTADFFDVRERFADKRTLSRVIEDTGSLPLALRWVVGQVSLGRSVGEVLEKTRQRASDIHDFCFEATVDELDGGQLKLLYVLSQLEGPADAETVANISGFPLEEVRPGLETLLKYSLVSPIVEEVWETDLYKLLPLTATYCAGLGRRWPEYSREVAERAGVESEHQRAKAVANGIYKRYHAFTHDERLAVVAANEARIEYSQKKDPDRALQMLDDAERLGPMLAYPHLIRAEILVEEERYDEARDYFSQAKDRDPQNLQVLKSWGALELSTGGYPDAVSLFEEACELSPSDVSLRLSLAVGFMRYAQLAHVRGNKSQRNSLLRDALRHARAATLDSAKTGSEKAHNIDCYEVQIEIYQKQDRPELALRACREGLGVDPDSFTLKSLELSVRSSLE